MIFFLIPVLIFAGILILDPHAMTFFCQNSHLMRPWEVSSEFLNIFTNLNHEKQQQILQNVCQILEESHHKDAQQISHLNLKDPHVAKYFLQFLIGYFFPPSLLKLSFSECIISMELVKKDDCGKTYSDNDLKKAVYFSSIFAYYLKICEITGLNFAEIWSYNQHFEGINDYKKSIDEHERIQILSNRTFNIFREFHNSLKEIYSSNLTDPSCEELLKYLDEGFTDYFFSVEHLLEQELLSFETKLHKFIKLLFSLEWKELSAINGCFSDIYKEIKDFIIFKIVGIFSSSRHSTLLLNYFLKEQDDAYGYSTFVFKNIILEESLRQITKDPNQIEERIELILLSTTSWMN